MFTGIIQKLGRILNIKETPTGKRLEVKVALGHIPKGASVAINGCCLTVVEQGDEWYGFDITTESWELTSFKELNIGDFVNVEQPLRYGDPLDGHLVQGHIDNTATLAKRERLNDGSEELSFTLPTTLAPYIAKKGSVTLDGISLTVTNITEDSFSVVTIPHTQKVTTLGEKSVGSAINIEVDILAKYVERMHPMRGHA